MKSLMKFIWMINSLGALLTCALLINLSGCSGGASNSDSGGPSSSDTPHQRVVDHVLATPNPLGSQYSVSLPAEYDSSTVNWPVVVYLHGQSTAGSLTALHSEGMMRYARENQLQAIVVAPLSPNTYTWFSPVFVDDVLREVATNYRIDPNRIVITGFSMGGFGAWATALAYPQRFAAVVPVAGALPNDAWAHFSPMFMPSALPQPAAEEWLPVLQGLQGIPVRAFHSPTDSIVPFNLEQRAISLLQTAGGTAQLTELASDHAQSANTAYTTALVQWMLAQSRATINADAQTMAHPENYVGQFSDGLQTLTFTAQGTGYLRVHATGAGDWDEVIAYIGNERFAGQVLQRFYQPDNNGIPQCFGYPALVSGQVFTRVGSNADCLAN